MKKLALAAAYLATIIAANAALNHWGVVPIGLGLHAPAGVYFAGLAFGLRDALHEEAGRTWPRWIFGAIALGVALSYVIESGAKIPGGYTAIAVASGVAFGLSELIDLAVYQPLHRSHWQVAVWASNLAGSIVDSWLFLTLAFGSTAGLLTGQVFGKMLMVLPALPVVWWARSRTPRLAHA